MDLLQHYGGEIQENSVIVTAANTDTQIIRPPWSEPGRKQGILAKLIISNQHATADALIKIFDSEIVTSGTPGTTLPPVRGTAAAPLIPFINLPAGTQLFLDENTCPHIHILGGLSCQATQQPIHIYAEIVVFS